MLDFRQPFERDIEIANDAKVGVQPLQLRGEPQPFVALNHWRKQGNGGLEPGHGDTHGV